MPGTPLENIAVILVGTKHAGNIGSAARAMWNMGFSRLRLAAPRCRVDEDAFRLAKHGGSILEHARVFRSVESALRGFHLIVGTTAKTGGNRQETFSPRALAPKLIGQAEKQKVAVMFGPEDTGLVDEDVLLCHYLMRIPTRPSARSINLAHAVMIICYELYVASLIRPPERVPELATIEQVEAMYRQLEKALLEIGFVTPETARHMMFALRRFFGRTGLEKRDTAILRGIARQIGWYAGRSSRLAGRTETDCSPDTSCAEIPQE
ncbi:MAG: RNA methyltransferase [Acidobacteria bacterium]|nr:RNA methyltransferase [Acidobacteriota bacterium]